MVGVVEAEVEAEEMAETVEMGVAEGIEAMEEMVDVEEMEGRGLWW